MKAMLKKVSDICKRIFGYGILLSLFLGGLVFLGYVFALIAGGDFAAEICTWIYKKLIPIMIYLSTTTILLGIVAMYMSGETALTAKKNPKK